MTKIMRLEKYTEYFCHLF